MSFNTKKIFDLEMKVYLVRMVRMVCMVQKVCLFCMVWKVCFVCMVRMSFVVYQFSENFRS